MTDLPRLLSASCVALAMTLAVLAAMAPAGRSKALAAPLCVAWVIVGAVLVGRGVSAWWVPLIPCGVGLATLALPGLRDALRRVSLPAVLATQALALTGLARLAAERVGWLPHEFTVASVALDAAYGALALAGAVWAARAPSTAPRVAAAVAVACVARVVAEVAMQEAWVRPLPEFEALWRCVLAPMFVVALLPALVRREAAPKPA